MSIVRVYLSLVIVLSLLFFSNCVSRRYCVSHEDVRKENIVVKEQDIDSSIYKYILPYKTKIDDDLNIKIAYTDKALEINAYCNNIAQLVYESMQWYADSVLGGSQNFMVLINYGGLRANIPQGDIIKRNVFELMPFDNSIVFLELNDTQLIEFKEKTRNNPALLVKSKNNEHTHLLVTSDYLYQGGDGCHFLKPVKKISASGYLIRTAILRYCTIKKYLNINCFH